MAFAGEAHRCLSHSSVQFFFDKAPAVPRRAVYSCRVSWRTAIIFNHQGYGDRSVHRGTKCDNARHVGSRFLVSSKRVANSLFFLRSFIRTRSETLKRARLQDQKAAIRDVIEYPVRSRTLP
jgi:hypothetical protein